MDALSRCEELIRTSEQSIHDTAISFIQDIRTNEKQTVEELHSIYGSDCMEYMDCKKDLAVQVTMKIFDWHQIKFSLKIAKLLVCDWLLLIFLHSENVCWLWHYDVRYELLRSIIPASVSLSVTLLRCAKNGWTARGPLGRVKTFGAEWALR